MKLVPDKISPGGRLRPWPLLFLLFTGLGVAVLPLGAQTNSTGDSTSSLLTPLPAPNLTPPTNIHPDQAMPAAPDSYHIGYNDLLSVFVYQMPELTCQVRVDNHGKIRIPFVSNQIPSSGLTAPELSRNLERMLEAKGLARNPLVQVVVTQVDSKPIVVSGDVNHPVVLQAARPMSVLEILSRAGGVTHDAGNTVLVTTHTQQGAITRRYNLQNLMRDPVRNNPLLTGNQSVTVLPARLIYVVGDFIKPGAFPLHPGEPITIIRAIALAQGFKNAPKKSRATIISTRPNGSQQMTYLNVDLILKHKAPDRLLQPGDILYVPTDGRHVALMTALTDAAQVLTLGAAYHFP